MNSDRIGSNFDRRPPPARSPPDAIDAIREKCSAQVSSKEVLDYLGFRDSKFMHAAFQLLGEPWDGSRMDFGETVKCIAQFCMFGMLTQC